jgi:hypothetical protein
VKKHYIAPCLATPVLISTLGASRTRAGVIAHTSFEEPATGGKYTDTGDAGTDHPPFNNPGEAPVNYTSTGGELGFSSTHCNTRDYVGVTDFTGVVGAFPDGSQGFQIDPVVVGLRLSERPFRAYLPLMMRRWPPAIVKVAPSSLTVSAGEGFSMTVMIDGAIDLGPFDFQLGFDPSVL